jgi:hypothetical protein
LVPVTRNVVSVIQISNLFTRFQGYRMHLHLFSVCSCKHCPIAVIATHILVACRNEKCRHRSLWTF